MKTFKIERHENGLFYVAGDNVPDSFIAVSAEDYYDLEDNRDKLEADHKRLCNLSKILLESEE